ncbi:hypothetical protein PO909_002188 [Leuciscus waleckii]
MILHVDSSFTNCYYGGCQYVLKVQSASVPHGFTSLNCNVLVCKLQVYTVKCTGHSVNVYIFTVFLYRISLTTTAVRFLFHSVLTEACHFLVEQEAPHQYYNSRQTLVASSDFEQTHDTGHENVNAQSGSLFLIGVPSSYYLSPLEPPHPRLPSYESVRKKDRQRQIHMMIADRFGLGGPIVTELPPTYEESIRQSVQSIDILSLEERPVTASEPDTDLPAYEALPPVTDSQDPNNPVN